jgi:hypothetical protein
MEQGTVEENDFTCPECKAVIEEKYRTLPEITCLSCGRAKFHSGLETMAVYGIPGQSSPPRIVQMHAPYWQLIPPAPPTPKAMAPAEGPSAEGLFYVNGIPFKFSPLQWRLLKTLWGNTSVSIDTIGKAVYDDEDAGEGRIRKLVSDTNARFLKYKLRFEITSPMPAHYILQVLPPVTPEVTET